ncbi:transcriptional regulator [Streptomyces sp. SAJ15]|uniref:transcriptional regulator n=1 Tax=Streptomyces sp. SAJ15 TaxID=2011095 RepID=UPI001185E175|nr:transcriptional regulator [Streptomyces sp. SAJ15]TVL91543.1 transcriptional regulator [Streptomyces sp. SAJ15]
MAARSLATREPNDRLEALIHEAAVSHAGLARRVNMRGSRYGLDLRYDKTSVSRWVRGQRPRGRTTAIIAEVLGEKLGRTVSLEEIGMTDRADLAAGAGLNFARDVAGAVEHACALWRSDAGQGRRPFGATVSASALVSPSRDWLITGLDASVSRSGGHRVADADPDAVEATLLSLATLDHRFGGGHVRPTLVHYLDSVVSGLLTGSYGDSLGRRLFSAAARLTELAGYLAEDVGQPSLAQRYYIQALRLSQAAGDRGFGGYVLAAGMSRLAPQLGYPREVTQLARAAREGSVGRAPFTVQSLCHAAEARGYALLGEKRLFTATMGQALEVLTRADPAAEAEWVSRFNQAYLAVELAHGYQDLENPALAARWAEKALTELPEARVRRRAVALLLLATARVLDGEVEEGCRSAEQALDLMRGLRSHLATQRLSEFRRRLRAFHQVEAARCFYSRLTESATS